jgi:hypothetical protein
MRKLCQFRHPNFIPVLGDAPESQNRPGWLIRPATMTSAPSSSVAFASHRDTPSAFLPAGKLFHH